jgi:hypothetical protein
MSSHVFFRACGSFDPGNDWGHEMKNDYDGFKIECFEAGKGLWHARIRHADLTPIVIDGAFFATLEVGFAWSNPDAAIADAKAWIDQLNQRSAGVGQMRHATPPAAA